MTNSKNSTKARSASRRATTLQDVAVAAGVSLMTVSNVVNDKSNAVGEHTRARVEREIKRLNYRPHASGRSLRLAHQWSVGMIIIHESDSFLADPFVTQVVAGLNKEMSLNGYGLYLQGVRKDDLKSSVLIKNAGTDGLCAFYYGSPRERRIIAETLAALGQPLILIQEPLAFAGKDVCCIREDDYQGGRMLAQHLAARGARRFVVVEPSLAWPALSERRRGIQSVLKNLDGASMTTVTCGNGEFANTQAALAAYLDSNELPHAIMASDHVAIAAMKLLARRGISVPKEILVTGFNGFEFWQYTDPVLTTIRSPAFEMGRRAGREMLHRLEHGKFSAAKFVLPVALQEGGST